MGDTFVGFTPAPDCIRDEIDALAALVYGAVWRFGQQPGGRCTASVATIAKRVGIGPTAARARLSKLVERGWLTAKDAPGRPTTYTDTGRWSLKVVGADAGEPQRETEATPAFGEGVWLPPQRETEGGATPSGGVPLRETEPKIVLKIEPKTSPDAVASGSAKPPRKPRAPSAPRPRDEFFDAFCAAFGIDPAKPGRRDSLAGEFSARCRAVGATIEQFRDYYRTAKAAGQWGKFDLPHNVADRFLATVASTTALDGRTTDAREPAARYFARRGTSMSDPAAWTAEARALYPEDAAAWAPSEAAR